MLILDDDPSVALLAERMLKKRGLPARGVSRVDEFWRELREWRPTHLVIDLVMPQVDGVELMRQLGEQEVEARIVILSGVGSRVLEAARRAGEARDLDVAGVVSKPFTADSLMALINTPSGSRTAVTGKGNATSTAQHLTAEQLRTGLEENQLQLDYQPKVDVRTRIVVGFEALLRWQHPAAGRLLPGAFMYLVEQSELADAIACWVLRTGARWIATYPAEARPILCINLSPDTLSNVAVIEKFIAICRQEGVDPHRFIFEMTESAAARDPIAMLELLTKLRVAGFHAAIDDVGTGYSSLSMLARLPFSEMKIDKSFVQQVGFTNDSDAIVASLITLAHRLGLTVIAEGVEREETVAPLIEMDCDFMQGYAISAPIHSGDIDAWYAQHLHPDRQILL